MDESADFADNLTALATFGTAIGGTVASTYRSFQSNPVPRTTLPQSAPPAPVGQRTNWTSILVFVGIAIAAIFGIRALQSR